MELYHIRINTYHSDFILRNSASMLCKPGIFHVSFMIQVIVIYFITVLHHNTHHHIKLEARCGLTVSPDHLEYVCFVLQNFGIIARRNGVSDCGPLNASIRMIFWHNIPPLPLTHSFGYRAVHACARVLLLTCIEIYYRRS